MREAMSHAWTRLVPDDVSWLTIGWEQDWMHTAHVGMAHCISNAMRRQESICIPHVNVVKCICYAK